MLDEVRLLLEPAADAQDCEHRTEVGLQLMQTALDRIAGADEADARCAVAGSSGQSWVGTGPNP